MKIEERGAVYALLDDCDAITERRSSRLYTDFVCEHVCVDGHTLAEVCASVQRDLPSGLHAVVVADYEFGWNLQLGSVERGGDHALRVLMFRSCAFLSREEVSAWLVDDAIAGVGGIEPSKGAWAK